MPGAGFHRSWSTGSDAFDLSTFRPSRVSRCVDPSYLALVKLFFLPSPSDCRLGPSTGDTSVSSSSVEPDDLVRIELCDERHASVAQPASSVDWRGGGRGGGSGRWARLT